MQYGWWGVGGSAPKYSQSTRLMEALPPCTATPSGHRLSGHHAGKEKSWRIMHRLNFAGTPVPTQLQGAGEEQVELGMNSSVSATLLVASVSSSIK